MLSPFASLSELKSQGITRVAIAIGVFDGVHAGHQQILSRLVQSARETQSTPVLLTFAPHPREILTDWEPKLLCSEAYRIELIQAYHVPYVVMMNFTKDFAMMSPEDFIRNIICAEGMTVCSVTVGQNWKFGCAASGNAETLKALGEKFNFNVDIVPELYLNDVVVSSSAIRHLITDDELNTANKMLNRPYTLRGKVLSGFGVATIDLDTPTANVTPENNVIPNNGVYASLVKVNGITYHGITAVGVAPTYEHDISEPRIEVHIISDDDQHFDLINQIIDVAFISKIRDEIAFDTPEELKLQIVDDIVEAQEILLQYDAEKGTGNF